MCGRALLSLVILLTCLLAHRPAFGEINLFLQYDYLNTSSETTQKETGEVTESEFSRFTQLYNLKVSQDIYPNLNFKGGGIFKLDDSDTTTDEVDFNREERTIQPFLELNLNTPIISLGGGYRQTETKETSSISPTVREFVDQFHGNLNWRPVDFPRLAVFYTHTNFHDEPETVDVVNDILSSAIRYEYKKINLQYRYTRSNTEDRKEDFNTLNQSHTGRFGYSHDLFDRKVNLTVGYRINYTSTEFSGIGAGTFPLSRAEGLFSPDDDAGDALESRIALINGDLTTPISDIDIGLGGDETKRISIGINLGVPRTVDTLFVWVDRRLSTGPGSVADSFVWEVYTSPDNTDTSTWTPVPISSVGFGAFNNRFEISILEVETQFIKVVTRPLEIADAPDAADFPNIFVTEIEGLITVLGKEAERFTSTDHNFNFGARWNITDRTTLGYNFFYRQSESDPDGLTSSTVSNTLDLSHDFSKVFTGTFRAFRSDGKRAEVERTNTSFSASLRAKYLPTLSQTVTFSRSTQAEDGEESNTNSMVLRTNAELYRGWSAFLDTGHSWGTTLEGEDSTSTFLRAGTHLTPHRRLTMGATYISVWSKEADEPTRLRQTGGFQFFFLPSDALSFSANISFSEDEAEARVFQNYSVNWSPFREGDLQLSLLYNERLSSEDQEIRSVSPRVTWQFAQRAELTVMYTVADIESETTLTDSKNLSANVRLLF